MIYRSFQIDHFQALSGHYAVASCRDVRITNDVYFDCRKMATTMIVKAIDSWWERQGEELLDTLRAKGIVG